MAVNPQLKIVKLPEIKDRSLPEVHVHDGVNQPKTEAKYVQNIYSNTLSPVTALSGTTPTIDGNNGENRIFTITLSGNTTYSIIGVLKGQPFIVEVKQGSGTTYTNTWFSGVTWATSDGNAPVQTTTSGGVTSYGFLTTAVGAYTGYLVGRS